jgi:hypothetical protein
MTKKAEKEKNGLNDVCAQFAKLYLTFLEVFESAAKPLKTPKTKKRPTTNKEIKKRIVAASCKIPALYRKAYVDPLLENFECVAHLEQADDLFAAVYEHDGPYADRIQCFVAVNSNLYRSFGIAGQRKVAVFPPIGQLPPLATFSGKFKDWNDVVPKTLTIDKVRLICGGDVAVVVMPSFYREHPILWSILAHEAGGHGVLHVDPALLPELQDVLAETLREELRGETQIDGPQKQWVERLWGYWLEETASHVCGVLNIGPSFGKGTAVYFAVVNQMVLQTPAGKQVPDLNPPYFLLPGGFIDTHPPLILQIHVMLGAISALDKLRDDKRVEYLRELEAIARAFGPSPTDKMKITGTVRVTQGTWQKVDFEFPCDLMQKYARIVGKLLASEPLKVLGSHSFREVETWDDPDEEAADKIRKTLVETKDSIATMGDDAQLLAGSLLAFFENKPWDDINERLLKALHISFGQDEIWQFVPPASPREPRGQKKDGRAINH